MTLHWHHKSNLRWVPKWLEGAPQPEHDLRSAGWGRRLAQPRDLHVEGLDMKTQTHSSHTCVLSETCSSLLQSSKHPHGEHGKLLPARDVEGDAMNQLNSSLPSGLHMLCGHLTPLFPLHHVTGELYSLPDFRQGSLRYS